MGAPQLTQNPIASSFYCGGLIPLLRIRSPRPQSGAIVSRFPGFGYQNFGNQIVPKTNQPGTHPGLIQNSGTIVTASASPYLPIRRHAPAEVPECSEKTES